MIVIFLFVYSAVCVSFSELRRSEPSENFIAKLFIAFLRCFNIFLLAMLESSPSPSYPAAYSHLFHILYAFEF